MNLLDKYFPDIEKDPEYQVEKSKISFAISIQNRLDQLGMNRKQLAKALGVSPSYVTKVLKGDENLTIRTMTLLAFHLDADIENTIVPRKDVVVFNASCVVLPFRKKKVANTLTESNISTHAQGQIQNEPVTAAS